MSPARVHELPWSSPFQAWSRSRSHLKMLTRACNQRWLLSLPLTPFPCPKSFFPPSRTLPLCRIQHQLQGCPTMPIRFCLKTHLATPCPWEPRLTLTELPSSAFQCISPSECVAVCVALDSYRLHDNKNAQKGQKMICTLLHTCTPSTQHSGYFLSLQKDDL